MKKFNNSALLKERKNKVQNVIKDWYAYHKVTSNHMDKYLINDHYFICINQLVGDRTARCTPPLHLSSRVIFSCSTCPLMDNFEIVDFSSLSDVVQNLIKEAVEIRKRAYIPYSNFAVGAAILTEEDSKIYTGCNIENSALTPSICAERAAVPKAVCDGYIRFKMIAIVAHQQNSFTAPCGVCRQTLSEFRGSDGDIEIYLSKPTMDQVLCTKLSNLLPLSFVSYKKDSIVA